MPRNHAPCTSRRPESGNAAADVHAPNKRQPFAARNSPPRGAHRAIAWLLLFLISFALSAQAQYDPDWSRHFRIGALVGLNIGAEFRMTPGQILITDAQPGPVGLPGADHFFDDGYVLVDNFLNRRGATSYFGYVSDRQNDAENGQLLMHSTDTFTSTGGAIEKDSAFSAGFELAYGGNFFYWNRLRIGWDFGFGLLPIDIKGSSTAIPGTGTQSEYAFAYPADAAPGYQLPAAPYSGGPSGRGALISDIAEFSGSSQVDGVVSGEQELDVMLYTFRLGPSLYWDFNRHIGMSISAGPAFGIVSGDLKYDQTFTSPGSIANAEGKVSGTEFVFGGYVNVSVMYHVVRNGDIFVSAQFMPLGDATISGSGQEGRLKLGGGTYVSAGINWPF